MVKLYVHGNRDTGLHFSPFSWRAILALKHKKVDFDLEILRMRDVGPKISEMTDGKWHLVPLVQFDDGSIVYDSFDIAVELDKRYPDSPKLFPNGYSNFKFYETYFPMHSQHTLKRVLFRVLDCFDEGDQAYFRKTREAYFGCTFEEYAGDADVELKSADAGFDPLRAALKFAPYLEGDQPSFSDYIYFSGLQMIKIVAPDIFDYIVDKQEEPVLKNWYNKIDDNFGGCFTKVRTSKDVFNN